MDFITVSDFVKEVMSGIPKPWGTDLVDRVFTAIENNPEWMRVYHTLIDAHGKYMVHNSIGLNVMALSGMKSLDRVQPASSSLIENYTELSGSE